MTKKRRKKYREERFWNGSSEDITNCTFFVTKVRLLGLVCTEDDGGNIKEVAFHEEEGGAIIVYDAAYSAATNEVTICSFRVDSLDEVRQDAKYRPYVERLCL